MIHPGVKIFQIDGIITRASLIDFGFRTFKLLILAETSKIARREAGTAEILVSYMRESIILANACLFINHFNVTSSICLAACPTPIRRATPA